MGAKKPSQRTVNGEKVMHYPNGKMVRIDRTSALADRLNGIAAEQQERHAEKMAETLGWSDRKNERLSSGDYVPSDKRPV